MRASWSLITTACALPAAVVALALPGLPGAGVSATSADNRTAPYDPCLAADPRPAIAQPGIDPRGVDPRAPNPLAGLSFFVDREEPAWGDWERWTSAGETAKADAIWRLAREPRFRWFGPWSRPSVRAKVEGYLRRVQCAQPGTVPQMVVMRHIGKRCHPTYDGGGAAEDERSRRWYDDFARTIGSARVVIGFEPDSLGTVDCLAPSRRRARLDLLRYGVDVLSGLPNATIYLEAGASDWEPARRTARQLRYIGINKVRGFMLNVTHHDWTRNNIRHGLAISRRVGGRPFVINTSYNGRGPVHYRRRGGNRIRRINVWCNPLKRGLGPAPTTSTSHRKVDAYLYINRPGYSAGLCNGGPLPVGTWWPERGLMYATHATDWEAPPKGTRYGHHRRYSLSQVGGPARR